MVGWVQIPYRDPFCRYSFCHICHLAYFSYLRLLNIYTFQNRSIHRASRNSLPLSGGIFRMEGRFRATVLIYASGKAVIAGLKSSKDIVPLV